MKVSELGEFGLIDLLAGMADAARDEDKESWQQLVLGIGDDAAAWRGDAAFQVATTDSLVQDVHFSLAYTSWEDLGRRAMTANISDVAAMGGLPRYALVSLALPGITEVDDVTALYRGMIELAKQFGVAIVGGDMSSAPLLVINITILGSTGRAGSPVLTRSAAKPGEKVAVTGYLGGSAAGLETLQKNLSLDAEALTSLKEAFLKPYPRVTEGRVLVGQGVRAAIDISDGLVSDLRHICQMSRVGARIEADRIPIHPAVKDNFGGRALEIALSGGEDYELLFTAGDEIISKVKAAADCPVTVIGEIVAGEAGKIVLVDSKGNEIDLPGTGWQHFQT
ncbi:thiamine-phosphate kinase [Chloroflexota bacterium]